MSLFRRNKPLSQLIQGMTDYHCHILPGVDDGFRTMADSLHVLESYEKAGVKQVWLTPHIMEDIPNTTSALKARFDELVSAYAGPVVLHLSSENMMDELFEDRLSAGDLLPHSDGRLLVETSYFNAPLRMDIILADVKYKGYTPLLAHPERYEYMTMKDYERLHSTGVEFQLNLSSLIGHYGPGARAKAIKLLSSGMYSFTGTDLHRERSFDELLTSDIPSAIYDNLCESIKS